MKKNMMNNRHSDYVSAILEHGFGQPGIRLADVAAELARKKSDENWDAKIQGYFQDRPLDSVTEDEEEVQLV